MVVKLRLISVDICMSVPRRDGIVDVNERLHLMHKYDKILTNT